MISDPYSILGVSRDASDREIKRAYRNMSRKYHPDSYASSSAAEAEAAAEKFKQIQEAYNQIVNERSGRSSGGMEALMAVMEAASPIPKRTSI